MRKFIFIPLSVVALISMTNAKPYDVGPLGLTYCGQKWEDFFSRSNDYGAGNKYCDNCDEANDRDGSRHTEGSQSGGCNTGYGQTGQDDTIDANGSGVGVATGGQSSSNGQGSSGSVTRGGHGSSNGQGSSGVIATESQGSSNDQGNSDGSNGNYDRKQLPIFKYRESNIGQESSSSDGSDSFATGGLGGTYHEDNSGGSFTVGGHGHSYDVDSNFHNDGQSDSYTESSNSYASGIQGGPYREDNSGGSYTNGDQGSNYDVGTIGSSLNNGGQRGSYVKGSDVGIHTYTAGGQGSPGSNSYSGRSYSSASNAENGSSGSFSTGQHDSYPGYSGSSGYNSGSEGSEVNNYIGNGNNNYNEISVQ